MLDQVQVIALLKQLSYLDPSGIDDGNAEAQRWGVRKFQVDTGLIADGICGPKTSAALERLTARLLNGNIARRYARFRLTRYYVESETDYLGNRNVPMFDAQQRIITLTTPQFFVHAALEGTGRLADGRLVNVAQPNRIAVPAADYAGVLAYARASLPTHPEWGGISLGPDGNVASVQPFELVSDVGVGYGTSNGKPNVPFKTLAADLGGYPGCDPRFRGQGGLVPLGTRVFIPEASGKTFPDGKEHDGWFTVIDTGSAIVGTHFDVFCGPRKWANTAWDLRSVSHAWFQLLDDNSNVIDTSEHRIPWNYTTGLAG